MKRLKYEINLITKSNSQNYVSICG